MPDVMANRRNSPRYALILVAVITEMDSETRLSARTSDVSRTGCYVDTLNPIPQGKSIYVALSRGEEVFETSGKIKYVSPGLGMGIMFDQPVDPTQMRILERWLEKAAHLRL
jgi:PilZ domain-containing protein